jgi:putative membrane protein
LGNVVYGDIHYFVSVIGIFSWLRFSYRVEDGELRIESGVFIRKKRYIPFERIQSLDFSEGIFQQFFGLVKVRVKQLDQWFTG